MKKLQNLSFSGIALMLAGITIVLAENIGVDIAKVVVPLLFIVSGVFAIIFSNSNPQAKKPAQYHMIQGSALIFFGVLFGLASKNLENFLSYATYFILFFGFFEIIMGFLLVNSAFKFKWSNLLFRFLGGLLGVMGAILILATSTTDEMSGLMMTGIITALIGIGVVIFSIKIRNAPIQ